MGQTVLAYTLATGGSVTDSDMSAVTDPDFSQRNSHYIFTESYMLDAVYASGANLTRMNIQAPTWNAIGRFNVWPLSLTADIQSPPRRMWLDSMRPAVPQNEEFTIKATDTASEQVQAFCWLVTPGHTRNVPQGQLTMVVRVTATITIVANAWSTLGALTFEQSLRGGIYSIVGAQFQGTHMQLFRLVPPRRRYYKGRSLRPGGLATNAIGDLADSRVRNDPMMMGEWGRFHTFEPPQLEIYGNTNGSTTIEGRLWLVYLGQDEGSLLDAWVSQGWQ